MSSSMRMIRSGNISLRTLIHRQLLPASTSTTVPNIAIQNSNQPIIPQPIPTGTDQALYNWSYLFPHSFGPQIGSQLAIPKFPNGNQFSLSARNDSDDEDDGSDDSEIDDSDSFGSDFERSDEDDVDDDEPEDEEDYR